MLTSICFVLPQHFACCTGSTFQVQIKQNNLDSNLRRIKNRNKYIIPDVFRKYQNTKCKLKLYSMNRINGRLRTSRLKIVGNIVFHDWF
jgi:hypothetical protein